MNTNIYACKYAISNSNAKKTLKNNKGKAKIIKEVPLKKPDHTKPKATLANRSYY